MENKEAGRIIARYLINNMGLEDREAYVEGMSEIMCLRCCQPRRAGNFICQCENDE